jgi:hypothetical protein
MFLVIIGFRAIQNDAVISALFTIAGYTYGPLLGLFFFGLFTKKSSQDRFVPLVCILSPMLSWLAKTYSPEFLGYTFGFELLILNGSITFIGLWALSLFKSDTHSYA